MLRKGKITEKISEVEYLVKDIFEEKIFSMSVSGKQRMNYIGFEIGQEVYFICSPYEPDRCRWMSEREFRMDYGLSNKKYELDEKQKRMK